MRMLLPVWRIGGLFCSPEPALVAAAEPEIARANLGMNRDRAAAPFRR